MRKISKMFKKWLNNSNELSRIVYLVILLLSVIAFINSLLIGDWFKISLAFAALVLYQAPFIIVSFFKVLLPRAMEITYYLFIFAALILGEVFAFYGPFPFWDIILHFLSGFMIAGIGISIATNMNKSNKSKFFTLLFAFCFSITLGVMWECLEFGFDCTARTDAQKDSHLHSISTITLQRDGGNQPVKIDNITKINIILLDGEIITIDEGFLDIGLMDTMKDILVNTAGATVFCFFALLYLMDSKKYSFAHNFIPRK